MPEDLPAKIKEAINMAISIDTKTFNECKELGGQVVFDDGIFHLVRYEGTLYVAKTYKQVQ